MRGLTDGRGRDARVTRGQDARDTPRGRPCYAVLLKAGWRGDDVKEVSDQQTLLWISDQPAPLSLRKAASGRWRLRAYHPNEPLSGQLGDATVAVIDAASAGRCGLADARPSGNAGQSGNAGHCGPSHSGGAGHTGGAGRSASAGHSAAAGRSAIAGNPGAAGNFGGSQAAQAAGLQDLLGQMEGTPAVAVILTGPDAWGDGQARPDGSRGGQFVCVRSDARPEEIAAQLQAAAAIQPAIANLMGQLSAAREVARASAGAMEHLDEEMRLAARLQRDFLPRRLPEIGPVRFGVLYRPATWLSGDIYDISRLDERNVGFYVADAVGHGMPAALLTMFIKHALQTKRIVGNTYQIIPPDASLAELNDDICQQNLSSCQFCTAVYCVLDSSSLVLTYSRAGHPPAVVLRADGAVESLNGPGGLLGVFPEAQFESRHYALRQGDRLVLFTDGAEEALRAAAGLPGGDVGQILAPMASLPRDEMLLGVTAMIDGCKSNPAGEDDITMMVVDVGRQ